jgi:hypothetical protein
VRRTELKISGIAWARVYARAVWPSVFLASQIARLFPGHVVLDIRAVTCIKVETAAATGTVAGKEQPVPIMRLQCAVIAVLTIDAVSTGLTVSVQRPGATPVAPGRWDGDGGQGALRLRPRPTPGTVLLRSARPEFTYRVNLAARLESVALLAPQSFSAP